MLHLDIIALNSYAIEKFFTLCESPSSSNAWIRDVVNVFSSIRSFNMKPKGALFLADQEGDMVLVLSHGIPTKYLKHCQSRCLAVSDCAEAGYIKCKVGKINNKVAGSACDGTVLLPLRSRGVLLGMFAIQASMENWAITDAANHALFHLIRELSLAVVKMKLEALVEFRELEIELAQSDSLRNLLNAESFRDEETGNHVLRVSHYCRLIAQEMSLVGCQVDLIFSASSMHDIGKIGISDAILRNPGRLTPDEFESMKKHTLIGEQILGGTGKVIDAARVIAGSHHERWDGTGYPRGLIGQEIPIFGRICSLADAFDALSTARPYKNPWPLDRILDHIRSEAGRQFDPEVVAAFFRVLPQITRFQELYCEDICIKRPEDYLTQFPTSDDRLIPWTDEYLCGIHTIDAQHEYLFELINSLAAAINNGSVKEIARAYISLKRYAFVHFREEEKLMYSIKYRDISSHIDEHMVFLYKLEEYWGMARNNPLVICKKAISFLSDRLIRHVLSTDMKAMAEIRLQSEATSVHTE